MTDIPQEPAAPEAATSAPEVSVSVGNVLREERLKQGLSVEDVSGRIKFAPKQIEALEADDFEHVPENAFLRGFVRSYARMLHLDPDPLIAALPHGPESETAPPQAATAAAETPYPGIYEERRSNIIWLSAALGVAVLLGLFAWLIGGKPKEKEGGEPAKATQEVQVETLALPAAVPVSAVPDTELAAHLSGNAATEKAPPAAMPPSMKMAQDKPKDAKQADGKPAEVKKSPQVQPASAVPPAKIVSAADKKLPASPTPAATPAKPPVPLAAQPADKKQAVPVAPAVAPTKPVAPTVDQAAAKKQAVPATPLPASAVPPAKTQGQSPAKPSGSGPIRVAFEADSWVEIKDAEGKIVMSLLGHNGVEQSTGGKPPFTVTVGYASGVKLYYKGKQVDLAPHARSEVAHLTLE